MKKQTKYDIMKKQMTSTIILSELAYAYYFARIFKRKSSNKYLSIMQKELLKNAHLFFEFSNEYIEQNYNIKDSIYRLHEENILDDTTFIKLRERESHSSSIENFSNIMRHMRNKSALFIIKNDSGMLNNVSYEELEEVQKIDEDFDYSSLSEMIRTNFLIEHNKYMEPYTNSQVTDKDDKDYQTYKIYKLYKDNEVMPMLFLVDSPKFNVNAKTSEDKLYTKK